MEKYNRICEIGRGAHGIIYLCEKIDNPDKIEYVAIKKFI